MSPDRPLVLASFTVLLTTCALAQTPDWQWGRSIHPGTYPGITSMATDAEGNVYVTGPIPVDTASVGDVTIVRPSGAPEACFVAMFNWTGDALWGIPLVGGAPELWRGDDGAINATVLFENEFGVAGSTFSSPAGYSFLTMRINDLGGLSDAVFLPALINSPFAVEDLHVVPDTAFGVVLAGAFTDTVTLNGSTLVSDSIGGFVARFDLQGQLQWAGVFATSLLSNDPPQDLAGISTGPNGEVFLAGTINGFILLGDTVFSGSNYAAYLLMLAPTGQPQWAVCEPGLANVQECGAVTTNANGSVFWALRHGPTDDAYFSVRSYTLAGFNSWTVTDGPYVLVDVNVLVPDGGGGVVFGGTFAGGTIDWCGGAATATAPRLALCSVDLNGNCEWMVPDELASTETWSETAAMDDGGNIYLGGHGDGWAFFGPDTVGFGPPSAFLAKLGSTSLSDASVDDRRDAVAPNPTTGSIDVPSCTERVFILDASGRQLVSLTCEAGPLDLSALAPGLYFISWNGQTQRVIKE